MQGANVGGSFVGQGLNMGINALSDVMNQKTKIAMQESENRGSLLGDIGGAVGAAAGVYNTGMFNDGKRGFGYDKWGYGGSNYGGGR
jgi:hypothetical protein